MHALEITNLKKNYGQKTALNGMSFTVEKGEFFGYLGPNGAGKTTTIGCITGTVNLTSGTISVFGHDVKQDYRNARMRIGIAPQEFNVDIFAPTERLIDYVGGYYGLRKNERRHRVAELLERLSLTEHAKKPFRDLSGGLKRRVLLARALVHKPDLLILDEPTAGVDVELRHELWKHLKELNEGGMTIMLTSHYLEEVEMLASRIAIINGGVIAAMGTMAEFTANGESLESRYLRITKGETW